MVLTRFFNSQIKSINLAAAVLAGSALISRLLGLVRDRLLAGQFGASRELDIYFASFRIPDLIFCLLFAGSIIVVFLPIFSEYFSRNKEQAWQMTNYVLNAFLFALILLCIILFIFTPWLIDFLVPGFSLVEKAKTIDLTRLMLLSPFFLGLGSIFSSVLQYFHRFFAYSCAPILYNLGIIFGIVFLTREFGIFGVGLGVILGAMLHFLIQVPSAISCGFRYRPIFNLRHPVMKKIFTLTLPRTFASTASEFNFIVITIIASTISAGAITIFNFSNNLRLVPVGLIGISFATASFPLLSRAWVNNQKEKFLANFSSVFRKILFLVIPLSIFLFVLREQIASLVLKTGQFGVGETKLVAACLGLYSFGIFAQTLIPIILRAFFSFQETIRPALAAIVSFVLNISFALLFVHFLKFENQFSAFMAKTFGLAGVENIAIIGLPLAFTIAMLFQFALLLIFLYQRLGDFRLKEIKNSFLKIMGSSILMGVGMYFALNWTKTFLSAQLFFGVLGQILICGFIGLIIFLLFSFILKSPEIKKLREMVSSNHSTIDPHT